MYQETRKQRGKTTAKDWANRILSILVTMSMITQSSPFAYANQVRYENDAKVVASSDAGEANVAGELAAAEQEKQPSEETPAKQQPEEQQIPVEQPAEQQPEEQQAAPEQPAEQQPTEQQPAEQPTEQQPAPEQPAEQPSEQQVEQQPEEQQSAPEQPAEQQPVEQQPAPEQPTEQQPVEQPAEEESEEQPAIEQQEEQQSPEKSAEEKSEKDAEERDIAVSVENATLTSGDKSFKNATGTLRVPVNKDLSFSVAADESYRVKEITLAMKSEEVVMGTSDGGYLISAADVANALSITVTTEKAETRTTYEYSDSQIAVTATLRDPKAIPDEAELVVTPVTEASSSYNYDAYIGALSASDGAEHDASNTLLYDVAFLYVDPETGETVEVQPAEGSVDVTFRFKGGQLTDGLGASQAADVSVTHLPLRDGAKADTTSESTGISAGDVIVEPIGGSDLSASGTSVVQVTADTFSVYAFSYTVDFTYDGYSYKFPGQGSYALADVLSALGIDDAVDNATLTLVEGVKIEGDLYLAQEDGVWYINSDVPFTSTYELRVECGNTTYLVSVSDTQESSALVNFVKNAVIAGATLNSEGKYVVEAGTDYNIILTFAENTTYQFDNDATLSYQMPEGIVVLDDQSGDMKINIVYRGETYQIDATYDLNTNGELKIDFITTDPDYPRLVECTNVSFRFSYTGQFNDNADEIEFSDQVKRDIVFEDPEPGQAFVSKSGTFDETTGTFNYTIEVTASGDVTDVNVRDEIVGNALIFNKDVQITGNSVDPIDNQGVQNGFDYTFASMGDGEKITITYSAHLDPDKVKSGHVTADQTKNTVTVQAEGGDPHHAEYSRELNLKSTNKSDGTEVEETSSGDKIIEWTIDYNPLALVSAANDTITDTIATGSRAFMTYYDEGITVECYRHDGTLADTRVIPWGELQNHNAYTWTYAIPSSDRDPYRYHITYKTIVDMSKVNKEASVVVLNNDANGDYGGYNATPANLPEVQKDVESYTTEEIDWVATITVPEDGLAQAVATDYLPGLYWDGTWYRDVYKDGTLRIEGLLDEEDYKVDITDASIVITFYKNKERTQTGLLGASGGRVITVRLTTEVNQDWLKIGYDKGEKITNWEPRLMNHGNTFNVNNVVDSALVVFDRPGVEKSAVREGDSFLYSIVLSGVSDLPISIEDTFDTSLLEIDSSKAGEWEHLKVFGGNQYGQSLTPMPVSYSETENGLLFTLNNLPMQSNGTYYSHYKITYWLKLKDGVDLMQLAMTNGGEYDLVNTAKWGDHESEFTYKTKYDYLDKELLNKGALGDEERNAKYQLTINPGKTVLNKGEPMTLTDTLSPNLSLDYSSVQITTDPEDAEVPYSVRGNDDGETIATYTIPDATKVVITYTAFVRGNSTQRIVNTAVLKDREKTVDVEKSYSEVAQGQGQIPSFKIVKVDSYDATKKLEGVRFKIFATDPDLDFGASVDHAKEIILETDKNGEVVLDGAAYDFYFDEEYHVQEVEPKEHYGNISFDYLVTLTDDMSKVSYGDYIYYYNDVMQIKNTPLEGLVVEKQVESDKPADLEKYYKFRISVLNQDGEVDTSYNEKDGDDKFINGVLEFELKNKQQRMFRGFLKGTKYKVEEIFEGTDGNEYATTVSYKVFDDEGNVTETKTEKTRTHTGELTQSYETIVFKNERSKPGTLKLIKEVNGTDKKDKTFNFVLTLTAPDGKPFKVGDKFATTLSSVTGDQQGTIEIGTGEESAKTVDVNLKNGETFLIEGLPIGTRWDAAEINMPADGYSLDGISPSNGVISENVLVSEIKATNKYVSGELPFEATKIMDGRDFKKGDEYTFTVTGSPSGAPLPEHDVVTIKPESGTEATIDFGKASFGLADAGKTYTYTVTETGTVDGVAIDTAKTFTVYVQDDGTVQLKIRRNDASGDVVSKATFAFTNRFTPAYAEIKATKSINDWGSLDGFDFILEKAQNEEGVGESPMPSSVRKTATKTSPTVTFSGMQYDKAGTYNYTLHEDVPADAVNDQGVTYAAAEEKTGAFMKNGYTYDATRYPVKVVVTKASNATNALKTEVKYGEGEASSLTITNRFDSSKATIQATKDYQNWGNETFTFTLSNVDDAPMPEGAVNGQIAKTVNKLEPTAVFGDIVYNAVGTYNYKITETKGTLPGVAYDETEHNVVVTVSTKNGQLVTDVKYDDKPSLTIKNTFTPASQELKVTKNYKDDAEWNYAKEFTFDLEGLSAKVSAEENAEDIKDDDGQPIDMPMPATDSITATKDNRTVSFGSIEFAKPGVYTYLITERDGHAEGVTYDTTPHKAVVTVTQNANTNALSASVAYEGDTENGALKVTNTFSSVTAKIKVKKAMLNDVWGNATSFTFRLEKNGTDSTPMPVESEREVTVTKDEPDGEFGEISYDKSGTFGYYVSEVAPESAKDNGDGTFTKDGVTYDTTAHNVVVTVGTKDGSNELEVKSITYDGQDSLTITNEYEAKGEAEFWAQKDLSGREAADGEFSFKLAGRNAGGADHADGSETIDNKGEDQVAFAKVGYDLSDLTSKGDGTYEDTTYTYHVTEVIPADEDKVPGVTYDETDVAIEVTLHDNGDGTIGVTYANKETNGNDQGYTFKNVYKAKGEVLIKKDLVGREWQAGDAFTFELVPDYYTSEEGEVSDDLPMPEGYQPLTINGETYRDPQSFGTIDFAKPGLYFYKVKEQASEVEGVVTVKDETTVMFEVGTDADGKLAVLSSDPEGALDAASVYAVTVPLTNRWFNSNGLLHIRKTVESADEADKEKEFGFRLTVYDSYSSRYGGIVDGSQHGTYEHKGETIPITFDENGVAEFKLSDGEEVTVNRLPIGASYTVEEIDTGGMTHSFVGAEGEDLGETAEGTVSADESAYVECVNVNEETLAKGEVLIKKDLVGREWRTDDSFTFELVPDYYMSEEGEVSDDLPMPKDYQPLTINGETYRDPQSFGTIDFAKPGLYFYNVVEQPSEDTEIVTVTKPQTVMFEVGTDADGKLAVLSSDPEGALDAASVYAVTVPLTNRWFNSNGLLHIRKTVESADEADKEKEFGFRLTLEDDYSDQFGGIVDGSQHGTYEHKGETIPITFDENGVAEFKLSDGEEVTVNRLPVGIRYTVEEIDTGGMTHSFVGSDGEDLGETAEGTVSEDESAYVECVNSSGAGALAIKKVVLSSDESDKKKEFTFKVTLTDEDGKAAESVDGKYGDVEFEEGVATVKLKDGESATAKGLPIGYKYKVEETDSGDLTSTMSDNAEGEIGNELVTVTCTNTNGTGDLVLKKVVKSSVAADKQKTFTFKVTLTDEDGKAAESVDGKYGDMEFKKGVATVKLKDGKSATAKGLPLGIKYEIKETDAGGLTPTMSGKDDMKKGTSTVTCTNTRKTSVPKTTTPKSSATWKSSPLAKTGDDTNLAIAAGIAAIGIIAVVVGIVRRRKNRE